MKNILLIMVLSFLIMEAKGQHTEHIISSSGNSTSSGQYALTFTFGEPVVMSSVSDSYKLSLGFIGKDLEANVVTSLNEEKELSINVFPNPFTDQFQIKLDNTSEYEINIYNIQGTWIATLQSAQTKEARFSPAITGGCYYIEIINKATSERKFEKIIKL
ncbi:MAG: T9SS type A sorting domain-containing protein [Sporocytophaga sp.]|uniref:T9SS type A sorting domain-containing protein n=1 Tax=Sporocytophaga sp. TaxID=2231183 RepID=UPI001B1952AF|nr:T9SS type A sorting domain-containing protein [Sporocytophaga sp.]MBO9701672.1 T9SS type A sorting domain-containing protein [Sporocytophaga sp.]